MSNSSLVKHTVISPNKTSPRNKTIDRVTIHCVVGQATMQSLGNVFAQASRQASSNYGVCTDGVAMFVEEKDRSWCSSSETNDHRAITIEVSCDSTAPYTVRPEVMEYLYQLLVDIVKRNPGLGGKLTWNNDQNNPGNMTVHRWFAATACPGDYLMSQMGAIADEVNKRLGSTSTPTTPTVTLKSNETIATEVIKGLWGNGAARETALTNAGYNHSAIQAIVNERLGSTSTPTTPTVTLKSDETIAAEVINGIWGNGDARKTALINAGYDYSAIQAIVNERLGSTSTATTPTVTLKSNETIATEVIKGLWGNGAARETALTNAGYNYSAIQAIVNERLA